MKVSDFLKSSRWLEGHTFLWKREEDWPKTVLEVSVNSHDQEVRKKATANVINVCDASSPANQLTACFSEWRRLKTAVAWFIRLKAVLLLQSCRLRCK